MPMEIRKGPFSPPPGKASIAFWVAVGVVVGIGLLKDIQDWRGVPTRGLDAIEAVLGSVDAARSGAYEAKQLYRATVTSWPVGRCRCWPAPDRRGPLS